MVDSHASCPVCTGQAVKRQKGPATHRSRHVEPQPTPAPCQGERDLDRRQCGMATCLEQAKWRPQPIMLSADHPPSNGLGPPSQVVNRPKTELDLAGKPPDAGPGLWCPPSIASDCLRCSSRSLPVRTSWGKEGCKPCSRHPGSLFLSLTGSHLLKLTIHETRGEVPSRAARPGPHCAPCREQVCWVFPPSRRLGSGCTWLRPALKDEQEPRRN